MQYRFGAVIVDSEHLDVRVDGERRPTEPQVFAVLHYLIEQRDRVVSKEELLDAVWGTQFVSGAAVTSRIKSARQAIGDTGRAQALIRTVHGRGYRFVAELDEGTDTAAAAGAPKQPARATTPGDRATTQTRTFDDGWPLIGRDGERDRAVVLAHERDRGGLLLTGPAGLGKTRLARDVIERLDAGGTQVARIHGNVDAATVPLGALAHLLPPDVAEVANAHGDMAKAVLLQRARAAIHERAGDSPFVLMVDDVDRVDSLSLALLASLIEDRSVFAIMTQRVDDAEPLAVEHLIRSGTVDHITLGRIPDDQMIALIGRVLDGPVQPMTSDALVTASAGVPGVLRQLIEASLSNGSLAMREGVWRLTGGVTPPGDMAAAVRRRLADLDDAQRDALELLAVAGDLDLDLAFDLIDDEVLDRLELDGMVSVREVGSATHVRLSHPLYVEILLDGISPLRDRRVRGQLVEALTGHGALGVADRLRLVQLRLDSGASVGGEALLESAALALIQGDSDLTLRLLRAVPDDEHTIRYQQLLGEVLYMRGRFDDAWEAWRAVDLDQADDETAAAVIRRITTWMFYGKGRYREAIEYLDQHCPRFTGDERAFLESYLAEISAIDGTAADAAIERALGHLEQATGHARSDFLSGIAMAHFVRGRFHRASEFIEERLSTAAEFEPTIYWNSSAYSDFVELMIHIELGDLADGWATFERVTEPGAAPDFGFASIAAGRLALSSGRWQQVLDWLEPKIEITEALGITTNGRPLQATASVAATMIGRDDVARTMQAAMRSDLPDAVNITTLDIRWAIERVEAAVGDRAAGVDGLVRAARDAADHGLHYIEALLLGSATHFGGADRTVDRLAELTELVDGDLIRLRHTSAVAALGRADPAPHLADLDARGLVFEATSLRATLGG